LLRDVFLRLEWGRQREKEKEKEKETEKEKEKETEKETERERERESTAQFDLCPVKLLDEVKNLLHPWHVAGSSGLNCCGRILAFEEMGEEEDGALPLPFACEPA
jgi:hypothetical protein